jgi:hypothetical protein
MRLPRVFKAMRHNTLWRLLLLILPVLVLPLATYIALEGQIKVSGLVILALFIVWLECIAVFLYRFVRFCQGRWNKP